MALPPAIGRRTLVAACFLGSGLLVGCTTGASKSAAGGYCRFDDQCRGELVCIARTCKETPRPGDAAAPDDDGGGGMDGGPDDAGGMDGGPGDAGEMDVGPDDAGGTDATEADADAGDAGGADNPLVRLGHLIANAPALRVCAQAYVPGTGFDTPAGAPEGPLPPHDPSMDDGADGLPFQGVSDYVDVFPRGLDYEIRAYEAAALDAWGTGCPTAADTDAPDPLVTEQLPAAGLESGDAFTIAAVGLADMGGERPPLCDAPGFDSACSATETEPHMSLLADDPTPASGMLKVRFYNAIANSFDLGIEVCHEPEGGGEPSSIAGPLSFDDAAAAYMTRDELVDGTLSLHLPSTDGPCMGTMVGALPLPAPDPLGTAEVPGTVKTLETDTVETLFLKGIVGISDSSDPRVPSALPYEDDPPEG
ncbi:MAG: hypothetical protein ACOCUS_06490 [Polyangiales bacterium]